MPKLRLVQDPAADAPLDENPFALLVGMLLDQPKPLPTRLEPSRQTLAIDGT